MSHSIDSNGRVRLAPLEVGPVTPQRLKEWLDAGSLETLTAAFPLVDNFRTRRVIADRIGEKPSPLAAACLIRCLASAHDESLRAEIRRKLLGMDADMVTAQLEYVPGAAESVVAVELLAALRTDASVDPLTRALADRNPAIRAQAIPGLAAMMEPTDEWLDYLAGVVGSDADAAVRMAAARALQAVDSREAFNRLDVASQQPNFDANLAPVLESMREKHGSGRAKKLKETAKTSADRGPGLGAREIGMILGALALVGLVGAWLLGSARSISRPSVPFRSEIDEDAKRNAHRLEYDMQVEMARVANQLRAEAGEPPVATPTPYAGYPEGGGEAGGPGAN